MLMHIQIYFSSSKLIVMELVDRTVVIAHCLDKVITNLEIVIWEGQRGCRTVGNKKLVLP